MLNEFLEFKAYVTESTSSTPRVQPKLLTEKFNEACNLIGIEHIMTVIARAFIFSREGYNQGERISEQVLKDTLELLHRWTGFSDTDARKRTDNPMLDKWMKDNDVEDSWLKEYWLFQYDNGKVKKKTKSSKEKLWEKLENSWNKKLNSPLDYSANMITYKNVVANALEIGPLRKRYLVVKKAEQVGKEVVKDEKKRFKYLADELKGQETTDMKFMKLIATYLIKQEYHPYGQKEVWIQNAELAGWDGMDDSNKGSKTWYPEDVIWNEQPVYTRDVLQGSYGKVFVNPDYLREYDFHIIDVADADKYKGTHWVLEDRGHGLKDCWNVIK